MWLEATVVGAQEVFLDSEHGGCVSPHRSLRKDTLCVRDRRPADDLTAVGLEVADGDFYVLGASGSSSLLSLSCNPQEI